MKKISVSPQLITINNGTNFLITDKDGKIGRLRQTGLFEKDTRYISFYQFLINGKEFKLLNSSWIDYYSSLYYFTNPKIVTFEREVAEDVIMLRLSRFVGDGLHEDYDLTNYSGEDLEIQLSLEVRADFADIFEVRSDKIRKRIVDSIWEEKEQRLVLNYENRGFKRRLNFYAQNETYQPHYNNGEITFNISLKGGETLHSCMEATFENSTKTQYPCEEVREKTFETMNRQFKNWQEEVTKISSSNKIVENAYNQAITDLGSLRLAAAGVPWVPAAGVPWFATLFGRDSLVTSLEILTLYSPFAVGVLEELGKLQGTGVDNWRDEEPGKIPHEIRAGELTALKIVPFDPYYGSADASLLYVITLFETYKFLGEKKILEKYLPVAEKCLEWAATWGDFDGDGFIEYQTRSPQGYRNQGWKDSGDAIVYPSGILVDTPIATCEIQGYYYSALLKMAEIYKVLGKPEKVGGLINHAVRLREEFNEKFWVEEENFYALGLNNKKLAIASITSNPGHLLWSEIISEDRASLIVRRLMRKDLFSGWGIRTLSNKNPAFNPVSYHRGSIWPHDNAIIAAGFKKYGFWEEANKIAEGIFAASDQLESSMMPELFAGVERENFSFPVLYLEANLPQAWAAGSIFLFLQTILGLEADAENKKLVINPTLPDWLPDLTLRNLKVGQGRVDVRFFREDNKSQFEILKSTKNIKVAKKELG
ncbi:MAG: amylo-alpha-1,6-glucosidase [Patescibacteria group bacterium]|nr:amylo-alpha-1,6-glucosidase [Patescibacteria group bacterium]MCL5411795.1 amylo-alpha-1,6-glucosidase [Patescibacteria group bacterium]